MAVLANPQAVSPPAIVRPPASHSAAIRSHSHAASRGQPDRPKRVVAVTVGPNLLGILARHRSPTHHYPYTPAHSPAPQCYQRRFHRRKRDREQRRQGDDVGRVPPHGGHEAGGRHIHPQIVNLESAALEQCGNQVLANVVEISLHGPDHYRAGRFGAARRQHRPHQRQHRFHRPPGQQKLGDEVFSGFKPAPHLVHGRNHPPGKHLGGIATAFRRRMSKRDRGFGIAL